MNTKTLLTISALALGLSPLGLPARADSPMSGMDMGGMKMSPTAQKPKPVSLSVAAAVSPAAPQAGDNALDLTITGPDGKPATGLKLTTTVAMTSMDMGMTHPAVTETGGGHYAAKVNFSMNGPWRVVVRNGAAKVAVLDFEAGTKTPWKSPPIKTPVVKAANAAPVGAANPVGAVTPPAPLAASPMPGMDMGGGATKTAAPPVADAPLPGAAKPAAQSPGDAGASSMGSMDMKTAVVPELQEKGAYTATGNEDWPKQTGFGHNAGMVAMMNQMMVGGSGMEGMKMPAMKMKFDEQNYAKPDAEDADSSMPGMDMSGGKAADKKASQGGNMAGMNMSGKDKASDVGGMKMNAPPAVEPDAPASGANSVPGMNMAAPTPGGTPSASAPMRITATAAAAPKAGDNPLTISVTDAQGKPVAGAAITTSVAMTSMDMGTTHPAVTERGAGRYAATVNFSMAGPWRVRVRVTAPGQKPQIKAFDFSAK